MFEGGYKNHEKIHAPNKGYGVVLKPEPVYQYSEGHPCHGCVFVFHANKPSCMTGGRPDNCINAFYKKMQARNRVEREKKLAESNTNKP